MRGKDVGEGEGAISSESFLSIAGTESIEGEFMDTGSPSLQDVLCQSCAGSVGWAAGCLQWQEHIVPFLKSNLNSGKRGGVFVDFFFKQKPYRSAE